MNQYTNIQTAQMSCFALALDVAEGTRMLKSPTGSTIGESTHCSNWPARMYHATRFSAKVKPPAI